MDNPRLLQEIRHRLPIACLKVPPMRHALSISIALLIVAATATQTTPADDASAKAGKAKPSFKEVGREWTPLFDGRTMKGWKVTQFGGE
jgi:hypothetical protein